MSDTLDLLKLILPHLISLSDLVLDLALELLSGRLPNVSLLLSYRLDAGEVLTELLLTFLGRLLALLVREELLLLRLLQLLLSLLVDRALSLQGKTAALLGNTRRDWTHAVTKNVQTLLGRTVELLLDVALGDGGGLRICLKALLDLWGFS